MANLCSTSLSIQTDGEFTDRQFDEIRKELNDTATCDGETTFHYTDDSLIECDIATRWNVPTDELRTIAKRHAVNIRAVGREDGVGFVQVVCINSGGEVVQDDEIGYAF